MCFQTSAVLIALFTVWRFLTSLLDFTHYSRGKWYLLSFSHEIDFFVEEDCIKELVCVNDVLSDSISFLQTSYSPGSAPLPHSSKLVHLLDSKSSSFSKILLIV